MAKRETRTTTPVVLVVDDEADILELLEMTLLRMGLDVVKASSVGVAIEKLSTQDIDLCLTDMRLPDGDGLAIIRYIQAERPQKYPCRHRAHELREANGASLVYLPDKYGAHFRISQERSDGKA